MPEIVFKSPSWMNSQDMRGWPNLEWHQRAGVVGYYKLQKSTSYINLAVKKLKKTQMEQVNIAFVNLKKVFILHPILLTSLASVVYALSLIHI